MKNTAILVVSFGASDAETRKVGIEACEHAIAAAFPADEIRRAFTSQTMIKILNERDHLLVDTLPDALQKLRDEGCDNVIVQALQIIPGAEFHAVVGTVKAYASDFASLRVGLPLLAAPHEHAAVVQALATQFPILADDEAVALMGHGSAHPANAAYPAFEVALADGGHPRVFVGTVAGYPTLDHVIARLRRHRIRKVTLMPLMLTAGVHVRTDMAGADGNSWKSTLAKAGFQVSVYLRGLGENPAIHRIFVQHVKDSINMNNAANRPLRELA